MRVASINNTYNQSFGFKFKLSEECKKIIERNIQLSRAEMERLPMEEAFKLIDERNPIKKQSEIKLWFAKKYRQFGKKFGLL